MEKEQKEFAFGITPLAGARFGVFRFLSKKYGVDDNYKSKWWLSGLVSLISSFLGLFDRFMFALKSKPTNPKAPILL